MTDPADEPRPWSGKTALIVAPATNQRARIRHRLERTGMRTIAWETTDEAVAEFDKGQPIDLVLLDRSAESASHAPSTEELLERAAQVPVIALTDGIRGGGNEREDRFRASVPISTRPGDFEKLLDGWLGAKPRENPPPLERLRILVAEDNAINSELLVILLEQRGMETSTAMNGREALALQETESFDLIFMDVEMPEMDGIEVTRRIRAREQIHGGRARIVGLSAHAFLENRRTAMDAGMDDYLTKPVDLHELDRALQAAAEQRTPGCRRT